MTLDLGIAPLKAEELKKEEQRDLTCRWRWIVFDQAQTIQEQEISQIHDRGPGFVRGNLPMEVESFWVGSIDPFGTSGYSHGIKQQKSCDKR